MSNFKNFAKLRNTLANFYPNISDAQLIVDDAGLRRENITFSTSSRNIWHGILLEAAKTDQLRNLIEIASEDYPTINAVYNEFLSSGGEIPSINNESPLTERHKVTLFSLTIWKLTVAITIGSLLFVLVFRWPQVIQTLKSIYENLMMIMETPVPSTPTLTPSFTLTSAPMTATPTLSFAITSEPGQATLAPLNTLASEQVQPAPAPIVTPVSESARLSSTPSFTPTVGTVTPTPSIPLSIKIIIYDLTNTPVVNGKHPSVPSELLTPGGISTLLASWATAESSSRNLLSTISPISPDLLTNWPTTDWSSFGSLLPISTTDMFTSIVASGLQTMTTTLLLTPNSEMVTPIATPTSTLTPDSETATPIATPSLTPIPQPIATTPTSTLTPDSPP